MKTHRTIALASLLVAGAMMTAQRPAEALVAEDVCKSIGCSSGAQKCAEVSGSIPDERCEEGVMCCPYPDDWYWETCYEGAI